MPYLGAKPTPIPLTSSDITDGIISTAKIADDAVTGAKIENNPTIAGDLVVSGTSTVAGLSDITIQADIWRTTANFTMTSGVNTMTNWERADTNDDGVPQGTGMSHSSGIFSFAQTGVYLIQMTLSFQIGSSSSTYSGGYISVTTDDSNYNGSSYSYQSNQHGGTGSYYMMMTQTIFDVQNISTHKVKTFYENAVTNGTLMGSTNNNVSSIYFLRIGNT